MTTTMTLQIQFGAAIALLVLSAACSKGGEGGNNPIGPSNTIPNVTGSYSGTTTFKWPELGFTVTCQATTNVTQTSGGNVSIAPLILRPGTPECQGMSIPVGDMQIDATGSLGSAQTTIYEPTCGGNYNVVASGGFYGRSLQASLVYTSGTCYNMTATINVSR